LYACSIFILLSRKSDGGAIFGRIRTRLGFVHFRAFRLFLWLLTTWQLLLVRSHQAAPYPHGRNNVCDKGESWT